MGYLSCRWLCFYFFALNWKGDNKRHNSNAKVVKVVFFQRGMTDSGKFFLIIFNIFMRLGI